MITDGPTYLAVLIFICGLVVGIEKKTKSKFFESVPAIVIIYFGCMLLATFNLWDRAAVVDC